MVISPAPKCVNEIDILSSLQNPSIGSLSCRVKGIVVGKAMCKLPKLHPLLKIGYQTLCILGKRQIGAILEDRKDVGVMVSIVCSLNVLVWPLKSWILRKTAYSCKLNQVICPMNTS